MPWKEKTRMDQRVRFVGSLLSGRYTMAELCRAFGISRKTGYKWACRYQADGLDGLKDRSRAPHHSPQRTPARCEEALVAERKKHPFWGPRKLLVILKRQQPDWPWPAASTAGEILKRHGLVRRRRRRPHRAPVDKPACGAQQPNDLWTADFKGDFRMGNRKRCYPLTISDRASRYLLACDGKKSVASAGVRPVFKRLFTEYGLPGKILTDNGVPFAAVRSVRRLSRLSIWWIRLGIEPVLIQPGHPEQNGAHERMHRTLKQETTRPPENNLRRQQARFEDFRQEFNELRPHEALAMRTPGEIYCPSPRAYRKAPKQITYPGHFEVRWVRQKGDIKWQGGRLFVSSALQHYNVGLEEIDDGLWSIYFGSLLLGRYDERDASLDLL